MRISTGVDELGKRLSTLKMRFPLLWLATCILALVDRTSGELYSAMVGLETLLDTQRVIISTLEHHISEFRRRIEILEKTKEEYDNLYNVSSSRFQDFISNPINAFVLMKRLSVDWNDTRKNSIALPVNESDLGVAVYPDYEDLSGAAKALLRVQLTYGLETSALSGGIIAGAPKGLALAANDCYELGHQAFHAGYFEYAISWLEEARSKSANNNESAENYALSSDLKMSSLEKGTQSLMLFTSSLIQLGYMMSPFVENFSTGHSYEGAESNNVFTSHVNIFDEAAYRQLCQSESEAAALESNLRCRLVNPHPYLKLQPVKEEELWTDPKISLYYDVISDAEIEIMKSLAVPMLQRAEVAEYTGHVGHRVSDTRVTKIAWLDEKDHPLIRRMYRRIEDITGLSSTSAEPFQMANYGLGGHFHLHMDVLPDTEKYFGPNLGNRIATWLIYLSDVQGGGATVFPRLNLTVWPKKGSALFWHNVKSNGVGNILTLHGACPVVTGSKWVSNVWFHERGQEFRLKCGMHPDSSLLATDWSNNT